MGVLAQAFSRKQTAGGYDLIRQLLGGRTSKTGKRVDTKTAIEVSTVFGCLRVIGEGLGQVPLKLMQLGADGKTRLPARDHPLYEVLHLRPNDWQTSFEYREMIAWHAGLAGNAFSFINRLGNGRIVELIPFEPGTMKVTREADWTLKYEVTAPNGNKQPFPAESIWHVRGPSWNSWMGLPCVEIAREAIGLSMATEESQASMHKNGVRPTGLYSVEGTLDDTKYKALKKWIDENLAGSLKDGGPMVMDRAAKWTSLQMTGVDAQHLETRRYQVEEICRYFRVNPIMVGAESKNTTYASAEQMFLAHVVHCLSPWYTRLEQSIDAQLLTAAERRQGYYSNFVDEGLLRGSMTNKKDYITGLVNGGVMTPNEGRAALDLNPDADPESDELRIPANIAGSSDGSPAGAADPASDKPDPDAPDSAKAWSWIRQELKSLGDRMSAPPTVNVDARTTVNEAPAAPITVNVPEQRAGDVRVDVAAPVVHVAPPEVQVKVEPDGRASTTTYVRDPETQEIVSSTTTRK